MSRLTYNIRKLAHYPQTNTIQLAPADTKAVTNQAAINHVNIGVLLLLIMMMMMMLLEDDGYKREGDVTARQFFLSKKLEFKSEVGTWKVPLPKHFRNLY